MSTLTDDLKNALSSLVSGTGDLVSTTRNVAKDNIVKTLQASGDVATTSVDTAGEVIKEGATVASETGVSTTQAVTGLVSGVIAGVGQTGGNVGDVAVVSIKKAIEIAATLGISSEDAAKAAVMGALQAADKIGSEAGGIVRKALLNNAALPHDIIDALLTGKTE